MNIEPLDIKFLDDDNLIGFNELLDEFAGINITPAEEEDLCLTNQQIKISQEISIIYDNYLTMAMSTTRMVTVHTRVLTTVLFNLMTLNNPVSDATYTTIQQETIKLRNILREKDIGYFIFSNKVYNPIEEFANILSKPFPKWTNISKKVYEALNDRKTASPTVIGDSMSFALEFEKQEKLYEAEGFLVLGCVADNVIDLLYCMHKCEPIYGTKVIKWFTPIVQNIIQPSLEVTVYEKKKKKKS